MRDLNRNVGRRRKNLVQENPRLVRAVRSLSCYRGPHVNDNRHAVIVRSTKHLAKLLNVLWVADVNVRITEGQLEAEMKLWILGTALELFEGIVFERVEAAESAKTIRKARDLLAGPVVLGFDLTVLVLDGWPVVVAELRGNG